MTALTRGTPTVRWFKGPLAEFGYEAVKLAARKGLKRSYTKLWRRDYAGTDWVEDRALSAASARRMAKRILAKEQANGTH